MKWLILALAALMAAPAAAQMRPVRPTPAVTVPDVRPVLERACLPVAGDSPVAAGIAAAKSLGFTSAEDGRPTLQRIRLVCLDRIAQVFSDLKRVAAL